MMMLLAAALLFAPNDWKPLRSTATVDPQVIHDGKASVRIEPDANGRDALVRGQATRLTIGKRYVLNGWLKTEGLTVTEGNRSSVPTGLSLSMASMPWDVHSESVGGNRDWTRVQLKFTATRGNDAPEIRIAPGASFQGKSWVAGVSVEEINEAPAWPSKIAVKSFGPAYRYPKAGWIYLHIEGQPYERGFQHGYLMPKEIEGYLDRSAAEVNSKDRALGWEQARTIANSVFLRGFDEEILAEMKGIADGAAASGARYQGRKVDLVDIVAANTITEIGLLNPASSITPTGLEGLGLTPPAYYDPRKDVSITERCSAFAATGKATKDGRMVIGHITWWPLTLAEQTNIMLDVKPEKGHRVMMQSYPGGIQSGTDWYQNDAGVILTETTIRQSPFNINGTPVAYRARKAIQYGDDVDAVVKHLSERNNGLYTNEWLIGDAKNDEIAMFELGTNRTKLWRSSKNEWFNGTEGFYWGCNNSKDLNVRLEYVPDPKGRPVHLPFQPTARDLKWQEMYAQYKGTIDEQFAFTAFRTAPLVSGSAFDSKVTTSEMAPNMMVWALLGKPNEREWVPSKWQKESYAGNEGIHSSGYSLFQAHAKAPESALPPAAPKAPEPTMQKVEESKLWKGWVLPASEADEWITLGSSSYRQILASDNPAEVLESYRIRMDDSPLDLKAARAVFAFDEIRKQLGDEAFLKMMDGFYTSHTTKTVNSADFPVKRPDLNIPAVGPEALLSGLIGKLGNAVIVYGTDMEAGANRYAAEVLQNQLNGWYETRVPIRRDFELSPAECGSKTLIFIGRPETNSALRAEPPGNLPRFEGASFEVDGKTYADQRDGLAWAGRTRCKNRELAIVLAGNSAVETVRLAEFQPRQKVYAVTNHGQDVSPSGSSRRRGRN